MITNEMKMPIGSWLDCNQDEESRIALDSYEKFIANADKLLRSKVSMHIKNNRSQIGKAIYKTRDVYEDNMSFKDFTFKVIDIVNRDLLVELIDKSIKILKRKHKELKKFNDDDIRKCIKCYIFFQPYIGYHFEYIVRSWIKSDGRYEIYGSRTTDDCYAIDMQILNTNSGDVIGLQLKSYTFLYVNKDIKDKYIAKNLDGIRNRFAQDIFYVFHDNHCNLISNNFSCFTNFRDLSDKPYVCVDNKESFLEDLELIFKNVKKYNDYE